MTTAEIANRLIELVRAWEFEKVYAELYSPDVISIESSPHSPNVMGFDGLKKKSEAWNEMLEELHGIQVSEPIVAADFFSVKYIMDITYKGAPRVTEDEIAIYQVKEGKIIMEKYYYAIPETPEQG